MSITPEGLAHLRQMWNRHIAEIKDAGDTPLPEDYIAGRLFGYIDQLSVELQEAREASDALRPHVIEDVVELNGLPDGAVLMGDGDAFQKTGGHFLHTGDDQAWAVDELQEHGFWPLTLLYRGSAESEEDE